MSLIHAVTVFCSSSRDVERAYFDAAASLGRGIALAGWRLVYGGNNVGCMGALADAARSAGGRVTGITPRLLVDKGISDPHCDELVVTDDLRDRKTLLEQRADAFVALPGGIGTLEEVFEILVARHLGYHAKPIVLLNIGRFYDPLLQLIDHGTRHRFIREGTRQLLHVSPAAEEAMEFLKNWTRGIET
jgi:uncharacterized protein (TIGR00730 family)